MNEEQRAISSSVWAIRIALFCAALVLLTIIFHRIFGMATAVALNLFALSFAGCVLVLVVGLFALVRIWHRGWRGGSNATTAMVIALAILAWPGFVFVAYGDGPAINDITTDTTNPPRFIGVAGKRPKGSNPLEYPGATFAEIQRKTYGPLRPLTVDRPAKETLELVEQALRRMRMSIVAETPLDTLGVGWGQVDAVDRTLVLGFYDDIAVRVTRVQRGSLVDIRSASRFGISDLGRNAERIREIKAEIVARIEATVPAGRNRQRRLSRRPIKQQ